jgi:hypothetical protein
MRDHACRATALYAPGVQHLLPPTAVATGMPTASECLFTTHPASFPCLPHASPGSVCVSEPAPHRCTLPTHHAHLYAPNCTLPEMEQQSGARHTAARQKVEEDFVINGTCIVQICMVGGTGVSFVHSHGGVCSTQGKGKAWGWLWYTGQGDGCVIACSATPAII